MTDRLLSIYIAFLRYTSPFVKRLVNYLNKTYTHSQDALSF